MAWHGMVWYTAGQEGAHGAYITPRPTPGLHAVQEGMVAKGRAPAHTLTSCRSRCSCAPYIKSGVKLLCRFKRSRICIPRFHFGPRTGSGLRISFWEFCFKKFVLPKFRQPRRLFGTTILDFHQEVFGYPICFDFFFVFVLIYFWRNRVLQTLVKI